MIISCMTHNTASAFARLRAGRALVGELLARTAVSDDTGRLLVEPGQDKKDHNR
jgi:hypothetical protein